MKNIVAILSILLLLSSCSDDSDPAVSGTVLEYGTEDPVTDAKIIITGDILQEAFEPPIRFFVDSVFTDANGYYEWYDDDASSADFYNVSSVIKENYFDISQSITILGRTEDIILDPFAWLHLKVIDDLGIPGDYCETVANFIQPSKFGAFSEEYRLQGNRFIYIKTQIGSGNPLVKDSIYLPALDTLYHEIRY